MWPWRVKMATQNLLRMLLLLILTMRIVSATVCCRFGIWGLVIKPNFCSYTLSTGFGQDFEVEVQARFVWWKDFLRWKKKLVKLSTLANLVTHCLTHSVTYFPTLCLWRDADVWLRFCLVLGRDYEEEIWSRFVFELVIWPIRLPS